MYRFIEVSSHPEEPHVGAIMCHDGEDKKDNHSLMSVLKSIDFKERNGLDASEYIKASNAIDQAIINS